jgi:hypothetical protein
MKIFKIYALIDPRNDAIRYVGRTYRPVGIRAKAHWNDKTRKPNHPLTLWLDELHTKGLKPRWKLLQVRFGGRWDDWIEDEARWIADLAQAGHSLANLSIPLRDGKYFYWQHTGRYARRGL